MATADHDHPTLHDGDLTLRPASAADLALLTAWFAEPEIYRWWGGAPIPRSVVADKYTGRRCPRVESFLITLAGEPIGYLQYHLEGPGQAGLDMMLIPSRREQGIGPRAAKLLIGHLAQERGWTDVTVDPARDNGRAIRAWEKAGFRFDREWPDHPDGPAILMRLGSYPEAESR